MKTIHWDEGYHFDDPNLRWGDPSYTLEPGDPGYVPVPNETPVLTQKRKKNTMPKADFIKSNEDAFAAQLLTYKLNIPAYATVLGVTSTQMADQGADCDYYGYVVACQKIMQNCAQQWTAWRDLIRAGGTPPAAGMP